jgi:hypothetical protein
MVPMERQAVRQRRTSFPHLRSGLNLLLIILVFAYFICLNQDEHEDEDDDDADEYEYDWKSAGWSLPGD